MTAAPTTLKQVLSIRWRPNKDVGIVALSWLLVVGSIYTANVIVGSTAWGGMAYFLLYAVVGATLFGIGLPLYWITVVRRRPIAELGITTKWLLPSLIVQLIFAIFQYLSTLAKT